MQSIHSFELTNVRGAAGKLPGMPMMNPMTFWQQSAAASMKLWENWGAWARAGMAGPFNTPASPLFY